jgi:Chaperone of endosialidase
MKTKASSILIVLSLVCFGLFPKVQGVLPPPDGGYPGFNTAEGQNALFSLTTGSANTAVGWLSLFSNTDGSFNTAVGAGTLSSPTGASRNTAIGAAALLSDTTGALNTAVGTLALFSNNVGGENTAVGDSALFGNTSGTFNTANGQAALFSNTIGSENTAVGSAALLNNIDGDFNTAVGGNALRVSTTGNNNTAIGTSALLINTAGSDNTAIGASTLLNCTGSGSIAIGSHAGEFVGSSNNVIAIGSPGDDVDGSCFIGNIFGVTSSSGTAVFINSDGQLGTTTSSRRFKKEIKPMESASEAILAFKPVTFHYKSDKTDTPQFGLIAEEVADVNPDLVVCDEKGEIYSVRYDAVNAMLLNEFLKEHRKVQELEANAVRQQKQIEALAAGLQKVSTQLELSKPAPQTILSLNP